MRLTTLVLLSLMVLPAQEAARRSTVRATGEAMITVAPDLAYVDIGVVSEATTAAAAAAQNAKQLTTVLAELKRTAGADAEIETLNYWVTPKYRDGERRAPVIIGYTVNNTVRVSVRDLAKVSAVIDAGTQSGANTVQGIQFTLRDQNAARARALQPAAKTALTNAEAIAGALGLKIVRVVSAEEGPPSRFEPMRDQAMMSMAQERSGAPPTPIAPRDIQVRATVTVTLEVR